MIKQFDWKFSDIACKSLDNGMGWYSWYIDWSSIDISKLTTTHSRKDFMQNVLSFYTDHNLKSTLTNPDQSFGQEYKEIIFQNNIEKTILDEQLNIALITEDSNLFKNWLELITFLKIPIYFGKSLILNERLEQHSKSLTDQQSGNQDFGKRFNQRLQRFDLRQYVLPLNLRVLIFTTDHTNLEAVERLINLILKPKLGIK